MRRGELRQRRFLSGLVFKVIAAAIYVVLVWLLFESFAAWLTLRKSTNEEALWAAADYDSHDAFYHYLLARYYHLNIRTPDMDKAIGQYREAVKLSPLDGEAWMGLSNAYEMINRPGEAEYAMERAVGLEANDPEFMWEAATFWLMNGKTDRAVGALRKYLLLKPDKQVCVYDLCRKLQLDNSYVLTNLVPGEYSYRSGYLSYLINNGRIPESRDVWRIIDKGKIERKLFVDYVNVLIAGRMYGEAGNIWDEVMRKPGENGRVGDKDSLLWNPGFEQNIMDGGFGWVIGKADGADIFIDDSVHMGTGKSLGVSFDGRENPDITIASQLVRVTPGSNYVLSGYVKTESLSTDSGIFFSVEGHKCGVMNEKSETVTGTNLWKEVTVDFKVPKDCGAVIVKIRRARSIKFDNKISGLAWIDGIALRQALEMPETAYKGR